MAKKKDYWIGPMVRRMKQKGTIGSFGKATAKNIAAGKRAGGVRKQKAVAAENLKNAARKKRSR